MLSLEQEIRHYFQQAQINFDDNSGSYHLLDFAFGDRTKKQYFAFDVKEKCDPYQLRNWPKVEIPEKYLFILDDLAARKILAFAPNSGLVIRDNFYKIYYFFSVVTLYLMPKTRVNRKIEKNVLAYKGKWLIDLRNGQQYDKIDALFIGINTFLAERENIFLKKLECYGCFYGEHIVDGGIVREPKHWRIDVQKTRK